MHWSFLYVLFSSQSTPFSNFSQVLQSFSQALPSLKLVSSASYMQAFCKKLTSHLKACLDSLASSSASLSQDYITKIIGSFLLVSRVLFRILDPHEAQSFSSGPYLNKHLQDERRSWEDRILRVLKIVLVTLMYKLTIIGASVMPFL